MLLAMETLLSDQKITQGLPGNLLSSSSQQTLCDVQTIDLKGFAVVKGKLVSEEIVILKFLKACYLHTALWH